MYVALTLPCVFLFLALLVKYQIIVTDRSRGFVIPYIHIVQNRESRIALKAEYGVNEALSAGYDDTAKMEKNMGS